ncbi:hypothetical protein D9M69_449400 [compost metagenome]
MDAALGEAGGAGGVRHHRHVVRPGGMRSRPQAGAQRLGPCGRAGGQCVRRGQPRSRRVFGVLMRGRQRVGVLRHQQVLQALGRRQFRHGLVHAGGQVGRADRHARLRIGDIVLEFLGAVHRVDRHHHRVGAQARLLLQPAGQRGGLRLQFAEGDGVAEIADRRLVGIAQRRHFQVVPERRLGQHDGGRQALWPELEMRAGWVLHETSPVRRSSDRVCRYGQGL